MSKRVWHFRAVSGMCLPTVFCILLAGATAEAQSFFGRIVSTVNPGC